MTAVTRCPLISKSPTFLPHLNTLFIYTNSLYCLSSLPRNLVLKSSTPNFLHSSFGLRTSCYRCQRPFVKLDLDPIPRSVSSLCLSIFTCIFVLCLKIVFVYLKCMPCTLITHGTSKLHTCIRKHILSSVVVRFWFENIVPGWLNV